MTMQGTVSLLDAFAAGVRRGFQARGGELGPAPYPGELGEPFRVAWGVGAELGCAMWREIQTAIATATDTCSTKTPEGARCPDSTCPKHGGW